MKIGFVVLYSIVPSLFSIPLLDFSRLVPDTLLTDGRKMVHIESQFKIKGVDVLRNGHRISELKTTVMKLSWLQEH